MGVAAVVCLGGCSCDRQLIDAHRPGLRASTWTSAKFAVSSAAASPAAAARAGRGGGAESLSGGRGGRATASSLATRCVLQTYLTNATSSGGTRFSLRGIQVREVSLEAPSPGQTYPDTTVRGTSK